MLFGKLNNKHDKHRKDAEKKEPPELYKAAGGKYIISLNGTTIRCTACQEISLKIPVQSWSTYKMVPITALALDGGKKFIITRSNKDKVSASYDGQWIRDPGFDVPEVLFPGDVPHNPEDEECAPYRNACRRLWADYDKGQYSTASIEEKFLYKMMHGWPKEIIEVIVDSLDIVISQFKEQDKKAAETRRRWIEEAPLREAEQKKRKDERQRKEREKAELVRKQEELEEFRNAAIAKWHHLIDKEIETFASKITKEFSRQKLLCEPALTNHDKMEEYRRVREFCIQYIPDLSLRGFRLESLPIQYPDYVSTEDCRTFTENWINLCRSHSALRRGVEGEEKVKEVLELYDDCIILLQNFTSKSEKGCFEHDFVVISPFGISTIEVKNLRGDHVLTESGLLRPVSEREDRGKDVVLQSKKHLQTLRRTLKGCPAYSVSVPLQEIICSANAGFTIKDEFGDLPVCYYNKVDKYILPPGAPEVLTREAMEEIKAYLLKQEIEPMKFDVFKPRGEIDSRESFIQSFSRLAGSVLCALDHQEGGEA